MQNGGERGSPRHAPRLLQRVDSHTGVYHGRWRAAGWAAALLAPRDVVLRRTWRCGHCHPAGMCLSMHQGACLCSDLSRQRCCQDGFCSLVRATGWAACSAMLTCHSGARVESLSCCGMYCQYLK